jgi:hypothetical protein
VSGADREQVIGTLKNAFVQGVLAKDEFDQRVGQALIARTYADLAALTAGIPPGRGRGRAAAPAGLGPPAAGQGVRRGGHSSGRDARTPRVMRPVPGAA